ncbi:MAG: YlxR family protein [Dehalococcoidia bacterium]|jgi:predicted RNA-binding protein YlxR (DUF448 family)
MMSKTTQPRAKHIPQRTCVACRETAAKRGLIRIVRTPAGAIDVDTTGKAAGRGAYLCRRAECWQGALKKEWLSRALRAKLNDADKEKLNTFAKGLVEPSNAG